MSNYQSSAPHFIRMLSNLDYLFKKAETYAQVKKFDVNQLLSYRLAPDMYPLSKQVQIAADTAKACAANLTGQEAPRFDDTEKTVEELRQRIAKTVAYLKTFKEDDFKGSDERRVNIPWIAGKYMYGRDYLYEMALPNFYFHITTAYNILRHNGVDLGKGDFLGAISLKSQ